MRNTHIYSGVFIIVISLMFLLWLIPTQTAPAQSDLDLAPALIPSLSIGICMLMAIIMTISALRVSGVEADDMDDEFGSEATGASTTVILNFFWWVIAAVVAWLLMEYIGFEVAMCAFLVATMLFLGVESKRTIALTAVLTPLGMSLAVYHLFATELPVGQFEDTWFLIRTLGIS